MRNTITIFEGPDGAGKSTAIEQLRELYEEDTPDVIHHGPYLDEVNIAPIYMDSMVKEQYCGEDSPHRILDRCWISETIYGPVVRNTVRIDVPSARILGRTAITNGGVLVLCLPPFHIALANFKQRRGKEYIDKVDLFKQVYDYYSFLTKLQYLNGLPIVRFDYTETTVKELKVRIETARMRIPVGYPGGGAWRPGKVFLLLGNEPRIVNSTDSNTVPFSSLKNASVSKWLTQATFPVHEENLYFVNIGESVDASFINELEPLKIAALGFNAIEWCKTKGIGHLEFHDPHHWRRLHAKTPYNLAKELLK